METVASIVSVGLSFITVVVALAMTQRAREDRDYWRKANGGQTQALAIARSDVHALQARLHEAWRHIDLCQTALGVADQLLEADNDGDLPFALLQQYRSVRDLTRFRPLREVRGEALAAAEASDV